MTSVSDASGTEGGYATFTVSLSARSAWQVTADYSTSDDTAEDPDDFDGVSSQVIFAAGTSVLQQTVLAALHSDGLDEFDEEFTLNLSSPINATLGDGQGVGTIFDNDPAPTISIADDTETEGTTLSFLATLSAESAKTVTVVYSFADNTAEIVDDYQVSPATGTLTFLPGVTSQSVTAYPDSDALDEPSETFFVNLSSPTNATIDDGQAVGTIEDGDSVVVSIEAAADYESAGYLYFDVSLSIPSDFTVTVPFWTSDDTAYAGSDYTANTGTLTFSPGQVSKSIPVAIIDDQDYEDPNDEYFYVELGTPPTRVSTQFTRCRGRFSTTTASR